MEEIIRGRNQQQHLKALYGNTNSVIEVNNDLSSPIMINRGVKQGCPLSPTLFNNLLNQESNGIDFETCQINPLIYVDDLVLIVDKPDTLDKLLLMLNQWCIENRRRINPDKTKIIHFRQPKKQKCEYTFTCDKDHIDYVDKYKHLGVDFTEHLRWAKLIQSTSISANRATNYLIAKAGNSEAHVFEVYTLV